MSRIAIDGCSRSAWRSTRILLLTKYGRRAASTRFRFLQYLPFFKQAGLDAELRPLLGDAYLTERLDWDRPARREALYGMVRRLLVLPDVRRFALVVVHMEALPYLPGFFERTLNRLGVPYVYDFDDASFHRSDCHPRRAIRLLFSRKIERIIAGSALVTAGNEYLADYARRFNPRVVVVPTVVDVEQFTPRPARDEPDRVVIGWIGSPSTAGYVQDRQEVWREVTSDRRSVLRLVGAGSTTVDVPDVDARPWRESTETDEVRDFDIGIMPLRDDPWSRGKCGFKLLEYLACGLPAVASPVGVNSRIITSGRTGFLCDTDAQWVDSLKRLVDDPSLRQAMGYEGREVIREHWSLQRWGPEFASLLAATARHDT